MNRQAPPQCQRCGASTHKTEAHGQANKYSEAEPDRAAYLRGWESISSRTLFLVQPRESARDFHTGQADAVAHLRAIGKFPP